MSRGDLPDWPTEGPRLSLVLELLEIGLEPLDLGLDVLYPSVDVVGPDAGPVDRAAQVF